MEAVPELSVVVPVRNGAGTLGRCLEALRASRGVRAEVLVVDDGSTDGSPSVAARFPVRLLRHGANRGAAAARNTGARAARAPLLAFVDADVEVGPETLARAVGALRMPGVDGVVGLLSAETEAENFASQYENLYMHFMYRRHPAAMDIFYTSFAAIRAEAFWAVGGFDERYRGAGIEDMDLGQRLVRAGYRLILRHDLEVRHLKRFTLRELLRVNRRKAAGTLRIMLRTRAAGGRPRKHVGPGWGFLLGIPLTPAGVAAVLAGALGGAGTVAGAGVGLLALVVGLNLPFLRFLARLRGPRFLLSAVPFLLLQYVNYGLGLTVGLAGYLRGETY